MKSGMALCAFGLAVCLAALLWAGCRAGDGGGAAGKRETFPPGFLEQVAREAPVPGQSDGTAGRAGKGTAGAVADTPVPVIPPPLPPVPAPGSKTKDF